jgi:hypothetical protein
MLLSFLFTASATEPLWPDLSQPPRFGGGGKDAAVIVAIEDYVFVSDISGATENGLNWYSYLTDGRGTAPSRVHLVTNHDATKEEIEDAIQRAREAVDPGGTLWFVFIGHGAPGQDGQDGLLVGSDTRQTASSVYARGLLQESLIASLEAGPQAQTVAVIDACFSGSAGSGTALVDGLQPMIPTYALSGASRNTVVLSAGASNQLAGPLPGLSRPAFSYLALGALWGWGDADGSGTVTTGEVHEYTLGTLTALPLGRRQTPSIRGDSAVAFDSRVTEGPGIAGIRRSLERPSTDVAATASHLAEHSSQSSKTRRLPMKGLTYTTSGVLLLGGGALWTVSQLQRRSIRTGLETSSLTMIQAQDDADISNRNLLMGYTGLGLGVALGIGGATLWNTTSSSGSVTVSVQGAW